MGKDLEELHQEKEKRRDVRDFLIIDLFAPETMIGGWRG